MTVAKKRLRFAALTLMLSSFTISAAPVVAQPSGYTLERVVIKSHKISLFLIVRH